MVRSQAEHREQKAVIQWATLARRMFPGLAYLFAVPNGGERNVIVASKLKAEGVRRGVPDLICLYPRNGMHGCLIEMKSSKGRVSPDQHWWLTELLELGYDCHVCYSAEEAIGALTRYLQ